MKKPDAVSPYHYDRFKIQPIEFIRANGLSYDQGNVVKYVCRHDAKNGKEDLLKAINYLHGMIADLYPDPPKPKRKRKPRVKIVEKVVEKVVERRPTREDIVAIFPTLRSHEVDRAITDAALRELQEFPFRNFRATTPFV